MLVKTVAGTIAVVTALSVGAVTVDEAAKELTPVAYETTAFHSLRSVTQAAQALSMVTGVPMAEALQSTELRQGGETLTVDGTTVTWSIDGNCWTVNVPEHTSPLNVTPC